MLQNLLAKVVGTKYERELKRLKPYVEAINALEPEMQRLTEAEMRQRTDKFRAYIKEKIEQAGDGPEEQKAAEQEALNDVLVEAFALVREAARRKLNMRHFDVQLMGGVVLHEGKISEMKTGEGKTLVATLPAYLNALTGRGVHLVTVNDYLARRDMEWMGPIYHTLGITLGLIQHDMPDRERKKQYGADIVFGTNNEFGFDYLRDNMKFSLEEYVQRGHYFAIVDEVDSILIDEARTPLIISGEVEHGDDENFAQYCPYVRELVNQKQQQLISSLLAQAAKLNGSEDKLFEKAEILLKVKYADPTHPKFLQEMEDKQLQKALQDVEMNYTQEKQLSTILDDALYFTITEESRTAELNKLGREFLAKRNPQLFDAMGVREDEEAHHEKIYKLLHNTDIEPAERQHQVDMLQQQMDQALDLEHQVNQLLKAFTVFQKDVEYVVKDNQVIIVDEFTGRMMPGRRWSDGLHQAVEAKEGLTVAKTNQTLATITLQNYFRMYQKLAGMTGTADTEAAEFNKIYKLDVVVLPTNKALIRCNYPDLIYRTEREKFNAVVDEVERLNKIGRPVLVGTVSIEKSEKLSALLKRKGIKHEVLNAKYHEKEAQIVAQAGRFGAVTIATNMAGRGTDIELGGKSPAYADSDEYRQARAEWEKEHQRVLSRDYQKKFLASYQQKFPEHWKKESLSFKEFFQITQAANDGTEINEENIENEINLLGGLHIIGTERHESRRIDDQLRGRSGRQGDPGSSRFYLSLEDDLMRIFGSERISNIMLRLGMEEGVPIEHNMITKAIENAQKRVEANNFEIRKRLLDYDDVMNKQREVVYERRREILEGEDLQDDIGEMMEELAQGLVNIHAPADSAADGWDLRGLEEAMVHQFGVSLPQTGTPLEELNHTEQVELAIETVEKAYQRKEQQLGSPMMRHLEKIILLQVIDGLWKDHLYAMDQLKEGIGLRGYGHKDPLVEYKKEGFDMFSQLMQQINQDTVRLLMRVQAVEEEERKEQHRQQQVLEQIKERPTTPQKRTGDKVGRNEACPCGSGKKYKKCCGQGK